MTARFEVETRVRFEDRDEGASLHPHEHDSADPGDAHQGGQGSPLVLLHGLTGTWQIWKPVLAILEQHHQVTAITLPGHSGGPALAKGVEASVANIADAVIAMLKARGIESAHVVGNSIGGWLALELARRGYARSVVALSPAGSWTTPEQYRQLAGAFRLFYFLMPLVLLLTAPLMWLGGLRRGLGRQTMEHAERIPAWTFLVSLISFSRTRILLPLLRSMGRIGAITPLQAPGIRIRIAWSGSDRVIPFEHFGPMMMTRVPQAELVTLAGVGHVPMYDDPAAVAACILQVTNPAASPQ